MRLTFLGTGAAVPDGRRYQSGLLLADGDDRLLVDCGSGVLHRLAETETDLAAVDTALLTHLHLDHVADLPGLLKARLLSGHDDFTVYGPPGTDGVLDDLLAVDDLRDRVDLTVRVVDPGATVAPIDPDGFSLAGFDVRARETTHSAYCLAYRFGDAVTVSGDTEADPAVCDLADGCRVLVHDCAYADEDRENHATPRALGRALAESGTEVERVYLTHLYPETTGRDAELAAGVERSFDGEVLVAHDLLTLHL